MSIKTIIAHEWHDSFRMPLIAFINELQQILEGIPAEFREEAVLDFDQIGGDMDRSAGELCVMFTRPKTKEEIMEEQEARKRSEENEFTRIERLYEAAKARRRSE